MKIKITDRHRDILKNSTVRNVNMGDVRLTGPNIRYTAESKDRNMQLNIIKIPRISDADYDSIKYIIEMVGCHWRERYGGFVSLESCQVLRDRILKLLELDSIEISKAKKFQIENQFYPTPKDLAKHMAGIADIKPTDYVLEPSAGRGAILREIIEYSKHYAAVECCKANIEYLRSIGFRVNSLRFEKYYERCIKDGKAFDKIIMNPPFIKGTDCKHIEMAYSLLKPRGTLVGLMAENNLMYNNAVSNNFNAFLSRNSARITAIPSGSFMESGTLVDVVMIQLNKK